MQLANTMYVNWWNKIVLNIPLNGSQFHHTPDSKKLTSNLFESGIIFVSVYTYICSKRSKDAKVLNCHILLAMLPAMPCHTIIGRLPSAEPSSAWNLRLVVTCQSAYSYNNTIRRILAEPNYLTEFRDKTTFSVALWLRVYVQRKCISQMIKLLLPCM